MTFSFWPTFTLPALSLSPLANTISHVLPVNSPSESFPAMPGLPVLPAPEAGLVYTPGQMGFTRSVNVSSQLEIQVSPTIALDMPLIEIDCMVGDPVQPVIVVSGP